MDTETPIAIYHVNTPELLVADARGYLAESIADRQTAPAAPAAGISDELATGIRAYADRIVALGGYGTRVRATMPDGVVREGALIERGYGGCQPGLQQDDGRRFGVNLDTIVRACLDDGDVA